MCKPRGRVSESPVTHLPGHWTAFEGEGVAVEPAGSGCRSGGFGSASYTLSSTPKQFSKTSLLQKRSTPEPLGAQEGIAPLVMGRALGMLAAVQLDEELFGHAGEVHDVGPDGLLAAELVAAKLLLAQVVPEEAFSVGLALAQGFGLLEGLFGVGALDFLPGGVAVR